MTPKSSLFVLLLNSWLPLVSSGETLDTKGFKFANVITSEVIVPPREIQGDFPNPSKEESEISRVSITKGHAAVIVKIATSADLAEFSLEAGLGVTNIAWGREVVVLMVRKFHPGGSSPSFLAVCSTTNEKNKIFYIDAISKENEFKICDIIDIKGEVIRVEAAIGTNKYRYIFGDVRIDSFTHSDSIPKDRRGENP